MALRRCLRVLAIRSRASIPSNPASLPHCLKALPSPSKFISMKSIFASESPLNTNLPWCSLCSQHYTRHFSSNSRDDSETEEDDDDDAEEEDEEEVDDEEMVEEVSEGELTASGLRREYSTEEKESEAAAIGYKVIGPLQASDRVFEPYDPVFAVVQIGSHQFKVSNGDCIFTERLKFCEVNDKLILNRVLLLGSTTQTIVGRPIVPEAAVCAVVEEHALDAKVIIFKKKRRKNYRRTKGHRQELTKLRITDIQGIEKPATNDGTKPKEIDLEKPEKVAVAA